MRWRQEGECDEKKKGPEPTGAGLHQIGKKKARNERGEFAATVGRKSYVVKRKRETFRFLLRREDRPAAQSMMPSL